MHTIKVHITALKSSAMMAAEQKPHSDPERLTGGMWSMHMVTSSARITTENSRLCSDASFWQVRCKNRLGEGFSRLSLFLYGGDFMTVFLIVIGILAIFSVLLVFGCAALSVHDSDLIDMHPPDPEHRQWPQDGDDP